MDIKPGMYVRTTYGIKQIYDINPLATKWKYLYKNKKQDSAGITILYSLCENDIIGEPSYNVKDLLEPLDLVEWGRKIPYVDGGLSQVYSKGRKKRHIYITNYYGDEIDVNGVTIYKILTKEQYDTNCITIDML